MLPAGDSFLTMTSTSVTRGTTGASEPGRRAMRRIILGLVLALVLAGCAAVAPSGGLPSAPMATGDTAGRSPQPSVPDAPPTVPAIDPFLNTYEGSSRGAWALVLVGAFGRVEASGQGLCRWSYEAGEPVFTVLEGDPVTLFGELVSPIGEPFGAQLWRPMQDPLAGHAHARYMSVTGSRSMDAVMVGDVSWLRFWDIGVDVNDRPPDPEPANWFAPLGGSTDTERVSGALAWRCLAAPAEPEPDASPAPPPTPRCPSGLAPNQFPLLPAGTLSAVRGETTVGPVAGLTGSITWSTCDRSAGDDTPWLVPEAALDARQIDFLVIGLTNEFAIVSWQAFAVPADEVPNENRTNVIDFGGGNRGPGAPVGPVSFPAPPIGDWVVVVHATSINPDGTVVADSPYYFRVNVSGID